MKWPLLLIGIFWVTSLFGQSGPREDFLPPFNFQVDSVSLLATWQPPKIVLLQEDFEGDVFPPDGWTSSTLGAGWQGVSSPSYEAWVIPDHPGKFALANDDAAGGMNNGSLDLLFTPVMDLTAADGFMLTFDSYFDAGWGQEAYVKYSLDSGLTWQLLLDIAAKLEWQKIVVDLSDFSGGDGESTFQLLFHAEDNGWASGWALDNVVVASDETGEQPEYYKIFLDNTQIAQLSDTSYMYYIEYNTTRLCGILAKYEDGESDTSWQTMNSHYLPPPRGLVGTAPDDAVILYWGTPGIPSNTYNREFLDSVFCFPSAGVHPEGGCDSDGLYIYSVFENLDSVYKYDFFGNLIERFNIPGIPGLYDLAYVPDEDCFYGSRGSNILYKMDFKDHELITTFSTPASIKGLAYDLIVDGFWASNWLGDMFLFDISGTVMMTIPSLDIGSIYGLAFDHWSEGGPYLWASVYDSPVNKIVSIDIGAAQAGPWELDLSSISQSGGMVGGLYTTSCNPYEVFLLGGNLRNDVFFGFELYEDDYNLTVPNNLLGFNIYKESAFLAYSPGYEPLYYVNSYLDTIHEPQGAIQYEVSAVYDMTEYGFPGDSAESEREGPAVVISPLPILELDYFEDWEYLSYDWIIPQGEWHIVQDIGNEAPAAVFSPGSILEDYTSTLKSGVFITHDLPMSVIQLSYDISLSSFVSSGNEYLDVQVYDFGGENWNSVNTYSNLDGNIDWLKDTVAITNYFNDNSFRIRFLAHGENSSDIEHWAVDNISVTRSCLPPNDVEATLGPEPEDSVRITWQEPWPALTQWREWDDGEQYTLMSYLSMKHRWFSCAARWEPDQLAELKGASLAAIGFIPGDSRTAFRMAVWTGEERELVYTKATENLVLNEWNIIPLDEPVPVDITKDLLVGYQYAQFTGYPLSMDAGPAIDGYGNLIQAGDEWTTVLEINPELDYNWNIKAFFERDSIPVENYELYRSIDGSGYEIIAEVEDTEYLDPVRNWNAEYCYTLKAVYPNEVCFSGYSGESCILAVSSDPVDISENTFIHIYPNPSSGDFFIESSEEMNQISIYNTSGMMIYKEEGSDVMKKIHLDVEPGIYFLEVKVSENVIYKKLIIH